MHLKWEVRKMAGVREAFLIGPFAVLYRLFLNEDKVYLYYLEVLLVLF